MAEKNKKTQATAGNKNASGAKSTVKVRNESQTGNKNNRPSNSGSNTDKGSSGRFKKSGAGNAAQKKHSNEGSFVLVGVILVSLAVLFLTALIPHAFGYDIFGPVGNWFCKMLLGIFGFMGFFIPVLMAFYGIMLKRMKEKRTLIKTSVVLLLLFLFLSALIYICATDAAGEKPIPGDCFDEDAFPTGGLVGMYLGYLMALAFSEIGGIIVALIVIIVLIAILIGGERIIELYNSIKDSIAESHAEKKRKKAVNSNKKAQDKKQLQKEKRVQADGTDDDDSDEEEIYDEADKEADGDYGEEENADGDDIDDNDNDGFVALEEEEISRTSKKSDDGRVKEQQNLRNKKDIRRNDPSIVDEEDAEEDGYKPISDTGDVVRDDSFRGNAPTPDSSEEYDEEDEDDDGAYGFTPVEMPEDKAGSGALGRELVNKKAVVDKETGEVFFGDGELTDEGDGFVPLADDDDGAIDDFEEEEAVAEYQFPPLDLLVSGDTKYGASKEEIEQNTERLRETLASFRIGVKEISCSCGPTITRFEVKPESGVRVRAIANLVDDIALGMAKSGVRIEAPIPGKAAVGIEVPNEKPATVYLRNILESPEFRNHKSKIAACLGADVSGKPVVFDIEKMPHLLVAGATGMGKSVCINSIILSLLYKAKPSELKLILIDPKKVEFNVYKDIPHLSCKIVTDPKKAAGALNSAVNEMEKRFELIEQVGVRNVTGYNEITSDDPDMPYMPRMVIIIDEFADLMMSASDDVETAVCRIAQKARAAGIHLIIGTQRPSVDVITGLIKNNIPSRIAFTVASGTDSRTILDTVGAEKLIGRGDMLYAPVGCSKPMRVQGSFVSDAEVERVVDFIRQNNDPVIYDSDFERSIDEEAAKCGNKRRDAAAEEGIPMSAGGEDPRLYDAVQLAVDAGKISTSLLQRRLEIGYGRAAKIIDRMEELGYVGPADGNKPRKILITQQDLSEILTRN